MSCGTNHVERTIMYILFHISTMYRIYLSICIQASEHNKMLIRNHAEVKFHGDYFFICAFFLTFQTFPYWQELPL